MTIFGGVLLYAGLIGALAGVILLFRNWRKGLLLLSLAFVSFAAGVYLPVTETQVQAPRTRLDEFAPRYQFSEFHSIVVNASKDRIDDAIRTVRPEEIRYFDLLTRIRLLGRPMVPNSSPILGSFTKFFAVLADDPGREIVIAREGVVKIVMNFRIENLSDSQSLLTTETRVYATRSQALHGFAAYWRMIYPGSSLIRREWLRAIQRRADAPAELTSATPPSPAL